MTETINSGKSKLLEPFKPKQYNERDWMRYEGIYYSKELRTRYSINYQKGKLIAMHMRMGIIELSLVKHNFFIGNKGFFWEY